MVQEGDQQHRTLLSHQLECAYIFLNKDLAVNVTQLLPEYKVICRGIDEEARAIDLDVSILASAYASGGVVYCPL